MKIKKRLIAAFSVFILFGAVLAAQESFSADGGKDFSLLALYNQGGIFMWPILILTAFAFGLIIERFVFFLRANLGSKEFIDRLEKAIAVDGLDAVSGLCSNNKSKIAIVLTKAMALKKLGYERVEKTLTVAASVEVALLERGLSIISAIANIVPMLGFLGTVTGMITAFDDIAAADQVSAKIVAGGIKEALLTTAFGLIAAIPLLLFYNYFVNRIEGFITSVERLSSDLVEKIIKGSVSEESGA